MYRGRSLGRKMLLSIAPSEAKVFVLWEDRFRWVFCSVVLEPGFRRKFVWIRTEGWGELAWEKMYSQRLSSSIFNDDYGPFRGSWLMVWSRRRWELCLCWTNCEQQRISRSSCPVEHQKMFRPAVSTAATDGPKRCRKKSCPNKS